MTYKRKVILPLFILFAASTMTGCSNNYLSNEEVSELDSYVTNLTSKEYVDIIELKEKLSKEIPHIENKDITSEIINKYIYILYNEASKYLPYFDIIGQELSDIKKELKIDTLDVEMFKKISSKSKVAGARLEEMYNKDLVLIDENNSFFTDVNLEKILNKYKKYLNNDIIDFLEFRVSESKTAVFDANADEYNVDELLRRASISGEHVSNKPSSSQLGNWRSTATYYYELLLARNTQQFQEDGKISDEYIKDLKSKIVKYKDKQIYKDITEYLELLEKNDKDFNAEEVSLFIESLFNRINGIENNEK